MMIDLSLCLYSIRFLLDYEYLNCNTLRSAAVAELSRSAIWVNVLCAMCNAICVHVIQYHNKYRRSYRTQRAQREHCFVAEPSELNYICDM